ncbi:hypothetical protein LTR34_011248, partial [Exophiala xenobiotica]
MSSLIAQRLAERLAGLPLALATAGALLRQSIFTFERYLEEYEQCWNVDPRRPLPLQEYQERTLYTTWDLSYTRLESEDANAARLLGLLAYFSNQCLWHELFRAGFSDDSPQWLRGVISSDVEFESAIRKLTNYCFLEVQTSAESWSMHNCVHDWTLAALNKVIDERHYWYAFDCIAASAKEDDVHFLDHVYFARLAAHAVWLVHCRIYRDLLKSIIPDRLDKVSQTALLLAKQVQLTAAEQVYITTLAGYEKLLGSSHTSTLHTVNNLGDLYRDQGKLAEAEQTYLRALVGKEKVLGAGHKSTLETIDRLGRLYRNRGLMHERALAGKEKELGLDHTSTLDTVNNLGVLYRDQGKLAEAEQMFQRALAGNEGALGPDHPSTLKI